MAGQQVRSGRPEDYYLAQILKRDGNSSLSPRSQSSTPGNDRIMVLVNSPAPTEKAAYTPIHIADSDEEGNDPA